MFQKTLINEHEIAERAAYYFAQADWDFNPDTESETAGRLRRAWELGVAMDWAERHGYEFSWGPDPDIHTYPDCSVCLMICPVGDVVQVREGVGVKWQATDNSDLARCVMAELAFIEMKDATRCNGD